MFFVIGITFLMVLSFTLLMLWAHERITNKRVVLRAKVEESWDGEERREHKRLKNDLDVEYNVEKKPHLKAAKSADISKGGMRLLLDEKLSKGSILDLKLTIPGMKKTIEVEGEVVWTNETEEKDRSGKRFFHTGIKFVAIKELYGVHLSEYLASLEL